MPLLAVLVGSLSNRHPSGVAIETEEKTEQRFESRSKYLVVFGDLPLDTKVTYC